MITKINPSFFYFTNKILRDAEIQFTNIGNSDYTLHLSNEFLRKLKIDMVNDTKTDAVAWYEAMLSGKIDMCLKTSYDSIVIIKDLHVIGKQFYFKGYLDGKLDFQKDILYSTTYSNFNADFPIYKVEIEALSKVYPTLLNLILNENEADMGI